MIFRCILGARSQRSVDLRHRLCYVRAYSLTINANVQTFLRARLAPAEPRRCRKAFNSYLAKYSGPQIDLVLPESSSPKPYLEATLVPP
jgi:hypothetical protein